MRILIVGHGVVGKNLEKELEVLHPDVIDKYKPEENKIEVPYGDRYDCIYLCGHADPKGRESAMRYLRGKKCDHGE